MKDRKEGTVKAMAEENQNTQESSKLNGSDATAPKEQASITQREKRMTVTKAKHDAVKLVGDRIKETQSALAAAIMLDASLYCNGVRALVSDVEELKRIKKALSDEV